jgi:hypothetical protein
VAEQGESPPPSDNVSGGRQFTCVGRALYFAVTPGAVEKRLPGFLIQLWLSRRKARQPHSMTHSGGPSSRRSHRHRLSATAACH